MKPGQIERIQTLMYMIKGLLRCQVVTYDLILYKQM